MNPVNTTKHAIEKPTMYPMINARIISLPLYISGRIVDNNYAQAE